VRMQIDRLDHFVLTVQSKVQVDVLSGAIVIVSLNPPMSWSALRQIRALAVITYSGRVTPSSSSP
jgi:hypothetical protein